MSRKRAVALLSSLAVSAGLLYWVFKGVDLSNVPAMVASARWEYMFAVLVIYLVEFAMRSYRWKLLVDDAGGTASWSLVYRLEAGGIALNNMLPFRLGELSRGWLLSRTASMPMVGALSTIAVERVLDVFSMMFMVSLAIEFGGDALLGQYRWIAKVMMAGLVLGLVALVFLEDVVEKLPPLRAFLKGHPAFDRKFRELISGGKALRSPRKALVIVPLSIATWLLDSSVFWFAFRTLGFELTLPQSALTLAVIGVGIATPSSPGFFGPFELFGAKALTFFGAPAASAPGMVLFVHLCVYLITTGIGLISLWTLGASLGEIWEAVGKEKTT